MFESGFSIAFKTLAPRSGAKRRCASEAEPVYTCSPVRGGASLVMITALRVLFLGSLVGAVAWLALLGWVTRDHD